jgi:uncharacterized protein (DUF433 family)
MKQSLITRTFDTCAGKPRVRGTRITVTCLKSWYDYNNHTPEQIMELYDNLSREQVVAAINYKRKEKIK